jgi:hypothetical protein
MNHEHELQGSRHDQTWRQSCAGNSEQYRRASMTKMNPYLIISEETATGISAAGLPGCMATGDCEIAA